MAVINRKDIWDALDNSKTNRLNKRLAFLNNKDIDTSGIADGVSEVMKVLEAGGKSFVIYGEPQSGKTETMIALTCKLLDEDYKTIFIVMNDNTELENQNFSRFSGAQELLQAPIKDTQLKSLEIASLKQQKTRIIFCRKNAKNLEKLIENCRYITGRRVVIDDEADYATPNSKINKKEVTKINELLRELISADKNSGIYIGVTATPGRLDLNNTYDNDSADWVFLEPFPGYKGRAFFFPITPEDTAKSDYIFNELPDDGDDPAHLRNAIYRFLVRVAIISLSPALKHGDNFSMLIHTTGLSNDHLEDEKQVNKAIRQIEERKVETFDKLYEIAEKVVISSATVVSPVEVITFIYEHIASNQVLVINHKNDKANVLRACKPEARFVFAIGGNIVSRGLTFDNLLSFFFSRNVKNKLQQNTYIQRARMFGNRPYSKFFELSVPKTLFENWADSFGHHELSLDMTKTGNSIWLEGKKTKATDSASLDKNNVSKNSGESPAGEKFWSTSKFTEFLKQDHGDTLEHLKKMKSEGFLPGEGLHDSIFSFIENTMADVNKLCKLVLSTSDDDKIFDISERAGFDEEEIYTTRGGIIPTIIHRRAEFDGYMHYIAPFKNKKGEVRFYLYHRTGLFVIENLKNKQKKVINK